MPVDASAIGRQFRPVQHAYTERDVILYALGVGCGSEHLRFTYERADGRISASDPCMDSAPLVSRLWPTIPQRSPVTSTSHPTNRVRSHGPATVESAMTRSHGCAPHP